MELSDDLDIAANKDQIPDDYHDLDPVHNGKLIHIVPPLIVCSYEV